MIDVDEIRRLVDVVAPKPQAKGRLVTYATEWPDFATAPDPFMPRLAQRLVRQAIQAGHAGFVLPRCMVCNATRLLVQTRRDGKRACGPCTREQYARACEGCGCHKPITSVFDGRPYCGNCWRRSPHSKKQCAFCGRMAIIERRTEQGPQCVRCAPGTVLNCAGCGQTRRITGHLLGGPRCSRCYNAIRSRPADCPKCGNARVLAYRTSDGTVTCSSCAGQTPRFACSDCGAETSLHGRRCYGCVSRDRIDALFTAHDGTTSAQLEPVKALLLASGREQSLALWTRRSKSAAILTDLVNNTVPVSHDGLDALPSSNAVATIRALLVEAGVLAARQEALERYDAWAANFIGTLGPERASILGPYIRWHVGHGLRSRAHLHGVPDDGTARAKAKARVAARFLDYLAAQDNTLDTARQGLLDHYVVDRPNDKVPLASFITWARNAGYTRYLQSPKLAYSLPSTILAESDYLTTIERLKADGDIDARTRFAGLLVALYGQRLTSIVRLKHEHISYDGTQASLYLGHTPVVLPRLLSDLLTELAQAPQNWATTSDPKWLLSSRIPGSHLSATTISRGLLQLGVRSIPLRSAALLNLAGQLPLKPICDLTGISTQAAARWAELAARSWNPYPAMRLDETARSH